MQYHLSKDDKELICKGLWKLLDQNQKSNSKQIERLLHLVMELHKPKIKEGTPL